MHLPEEATEKAKDLVRMAVTKARLLYPLERISLNIIHQGLVIGGGVSGMNAALSLAQAGFETYLVEKEKELGGFVHNLRYTLKGNDVQEYLRSLVDKVQTNRLIHTFTGSTITDISGYVGDFHTILTDHSGEKRELDHGIVIVATGADEFLPNEYFYGEDPRVVTQSELERRLAGNQISDLKNVVMIQCVGSRDGEHPYCSRVCCSEAIKNALKIKEQSPHANVYVLYRDMRTYGMAEDYYRKARENGVIFIRYDEDKKPIVSKQKLENGEDVVKVSVYDPIIGEQLLLDTDLLVLSVAIVASSDNGKLAQMLKVPINEDGFFLEAHVKLRPVDFATEGIFLCGMAHSPKSIEESIAQANAAVSRACTILSKDVLEAEGIVASVDEKNCSGCGTCINLCPYNAITKSEYGIAEVNPVLCKGCGLCGASCPERAISIAHFTDQQIIAQANALMETMI